MHYTALYRQFRPQSFKDVVGQNHISITLLNSIQAGKVPHAYLFCGPRGTGKTSTAKIFAKAINCLQPENGEPCNECTNCTKITAGNSLDVIEIDAASNRGIDEIRDLREKVKYVPAEGQYKVYIIDEVHMLTTEAFNALLKTLEEPPKHIVFVLATTEPHKLPATIISRCQRFDFKRIEFTIIFEQLKKVCADVGINAEDKALTLIAKKAEGGMRDALSLLDQSAAFGNGEVSYGMVLEILGGLHESEILYLLNAIITENAVEMLTSVGRYVEEGKDLKNILHELQEMVRNTILAKLSAEKPEILDEEFFNQLKALASKTEIKKLYRTLEIFAETENTIKYATQSRITLEIGLLRTISEEVKEIQMQPAQTSVHPKPVQKNMEAPVKKVVEVEQDDEINTPNEDEKTAWKKLLEEVRKTKKTLYAFLIEGEPVAFSNNIFKIEFNYEKEFHYSKIVSPENLKILNQFIHKLWGEGINAKVTLRLPENNEDQLTKKVKDLFGNKLEIID